MKSLLITIACVTLASGAFAQHQSSNTVSGPTTQNRDQMTSPGAIGTLDTLIPGRSVTIVASAFSHPVKYVMAKDAKIETDAGQPMQPESVRAGTRVRLEFSGNQVDRVVVVQAAR
jgi:hypothetical protein